MKEMTISFIVPLYNEEKSIALCLDSIIGEIREGDEIIVVDNGSTDNSLTIVRSYEAVRVLERPGIFIGALRNVGAMSAKGDILAFIDADCVVCRNWRKHVLNSFNNQDIAACGSKYELPANACWIEKAWFSQRNKTAGSANYINSGNLAVSKTVFAEIGGFDANLVTGEDAELGWRLRSRGYTVWENPDVKAIHLGNPKDLWGFYKKQRWHGMGMFGTFRISRLDKPVIMTFIFLFCLLSAFGLIMIYGKRWEAPVLLFAIMSILIVPAASSLYRCFQFRIIAQLPKLFFLYLVYFTARVDSLLRIFYKTIVSFSANKTLA
jgi:glycosyltransferase involved in cell wall biosynthesis